MEIAEVFIADDVKTTMETRVARGTCVAQASTTMGTYLNDNMAHAVSDA